MKTVLGAIAGFVIWSVLWLGGGAALRQAFPGQITEEGVVTATAPLLAILALSVLCSLIAGFSAKRIGNSGGAVGLCAVLLLGTGIAVQYQIWEKMPLWYHLVFLGLLLPMTFAGGSFAGTRDTRRY